MYATREMLTFSSVVHGLDWNGNLIEPYTGPDFWCVPKSAAPAVAMNSATTIIAQIFDTNFLSIYFPYRIFGAGKREDPHVERGSSSPHAVRGIVGRGI